MQAVSLSPLSPFQFDTAAVAAMCAQINAEQPLWKLLAALLPDRDPEAEWYRLADIAPLLGITPHALSKHARDLWPEWKGQYRLNYDQAVALLKRGVYAGRKLPARAEVEARLQHSKK